MDSIENQITSGAQPSPPPNRSLQTCPGGRELAQPIDRLAPATDKQIVTALAGVLVLVAPSGFSEGDRRAWLASATITLKGIPPDLLERGVAHARRVADHPAKVIPAIMVEIEESWEGRKTERRRDHEFARGRCLAPPEPEFDACTPEETAQIMAEYGLKTETRAMLRQHLGPPRKPTRADYIALGVDPAILDTAETQFPE